MESGNRQPTTIALRRAAAILAVAALAVGAAKVVSVSSAPGSGFSTVQTAAADPTGPTGPGSGGMTGPPGGGSEFVPPSMPSMPDYQGGNQPPLDQNNGISIYNTGAQGVPQQPGQASGPRQGQNADGSWQRAANGEQQPIQYSTPPQYTGSQSIPNTAPQQPQQSPQRGNQGSNNSQQPQQGSQDQQQNQGPSQTQQPDNDDQQDSQIKRQCQLAAQQLGIPEDQFVTIPAGVGGSLTGQPSRHWEAALSCCGDDAQELPANQPKPSDQNQQCAPEQMHLVVDDTVRNFENLPDFPRSFNNGLTRPTGPYEALTGDPAGEGVDAPMRLSVTLGDSVDGTVINEGPYGTDVAAPPPPFNTPPEIGNRDAGGRVITNSTIPNSDGLFIGEVATGWDINNIFSHGRMIFQKSGVGAASMVSKLPEDLAAISAYAQGGAVALVGTRNNGAGPRELWTVPLTDIGRASFNLYDYPSKILSESGNGQGTLTKAIIKGQEMWVLYETTNDQQGARTTMTTRIAKTLEELPGAGRKKITKQNGEGISPNYHGADQVPLDDAGRLSLLTSRGGADDGYGITELRGAFQC